jgi:hypothetical protein
MTARSNKPTQVKRRRSYGQANIDKRSKALGVHREVIREDAQRIEAAITLLFAEDDERADLPEMTGTYSRPRLQILEPTLVRGQFGKGFEAGYNFRKAMEDIRVACGGCDELTVPIDAIALVGLKGRRREIVINLHNQRIHKEQKVVHECLGAAGMRGFAGKTALRPARLPVARTKLHVPTEKELDKLCQRGKSPQPFRMSAEEVAEKVEVTLVEADILELTFGPAVVKAA